MAVEFYPTPRSAVYELLQEVAVARPWDRPLVLDAGCGDGALGGYTKAQWPLAEVVGLELDPGLADAARATGHYRQVHTADFLDPSTHPSPDRMPDLVIANPPFTRWTEFVDHIRYAWSSDWGPHTVVAVLGRIGLLEAQKRAAFWERRQEGLVLRPLVARQSFTGDGHSDRYGLAWFVWGLRNAPALRWYRGRE